MKSQLQDREDYLLKCLRIISELNHNKATHHIDLHCPEVNCVGSQYPAFSAAKDIVELRCNSCGRVVNY